MGKKIECYLDCVSPYSFYAFTYLQQNADALASLGVEIEYEALHSELSRK
jgi:2-hydroxychromene-2-carboxylate isomerase